MEQERIHPKIRKYCQHIVKAQIEVLRYNMQKKVWYWDLPAMASVCHDGKYGRCKNGYAHPPKGTKWNDILRRKMLRLGNIGEHSTRGERNIIGNCAEQHAGNNYMNSYKEKNMENLYFSEAVRPRTMEVYPPCDNCKYIFPNLK